MTVNTFIQSLKQKCPQVVIQHQSEIAKHIATLDDGARDGLWMRFDKGYAGQVYPTLADVTKHGVESVVVPNEVAVGDVVNQVMQAIRGRQQKTPFKKITQRYGTDQPINDVFGNFDIWAAQKERFNQFTNYAFEIAGKLK